MTTVRDETYRLMRALGLHEASVFAMADGYTQATGRSAFVNLHTAPGVGSAMRAIVGA